MYAGSPRALKNPYDKYFKLVVNSSNVAQQQGINELYPKPGVFNSIILHRNAYSQQPYPYSGFTVLSDNTLTVPLDDPSMFELT